MACRAEPAVRPQMPVCNSPWTSLLVACGSEIERSALKPGLLLNESQWRLRRRVIWRRNAQFIHFSAL